MFLWSLLVVLVAWTVVFRFRRRRMYELASHIKPPKYEYPIIGVAPSLAGSTEDIMCTLQRFSYEAMGQQGIVKAWLNHILYFYILGMLLTIIINYYRLTIYILLYNIQVCYHYVLRHVITILSFLINLTDLVVLPNRKFLQRIIAIFIVCIQLLTVTLFTYNFIAYQTMKTYIILCVVVNPADSEMVLKTCLEKDDLHRFIRKIIGYGGIFAPVPIWRRRRKILLPAFSPKILENFVEVFSEQSEKLAGKLSDRDSKGNFSIWPFVSSYTLDSVCETAMGVKINAQSNPNSSPFLTSLNKVLNIVCERIFHLWLQPDWMFRIFPQYSVHEKCIKVLHNFTDEVIQRKRTELKNEKRSQPEADYHFDLENYQRKTFLDLLINLSGGEKGYTDIELREEVLTLTVAGTDTSAVAIGFTLMLLGKYPNIQDKVWEELNHVFGESSRPLVKEDLQNLKYLERVVKESLRLFPPVPFIIRKIENDIKLPTGSFLPAGSGIVVSIWGCHRNPEFWGPDAECFDPDRFLPERFNLVQTGSYLPFSNGPRNCLGYQYALMSIKTALTAILRNYKVLGEPEPTPIPQIRVKLDIMMKAVDGYEVSLEKRKSSKVI